MPKQLELSIQVAGFSAQGLFETIYGGPQFLLAYHERFNNDPAAEVGEWHGNERAVSFCTPVDAPAFIKRMVGKEVMRVNETQRRAFGADGSVQLTSLPVPEMPGGAKFATQAAFVFREAGGGCLVHCVVTCTAAGPYGLTGTIESFMAEAAKKSLQEFLEFIPAFVQAAVGQPAALAVPAPPPLAALGPPAIPAAAGAGRGSAAAAAEAEQFYDAQELPLPPFPVAAAAPGRGMSFEDAALLYLRYQCRTGDQSVALLQSLESEVRGLREQVSALQAAEEARRRHRSWLPELPETVGTRQALLGAALLATASAAAALAYGRHARQGAAHG